ncbi:transporter substrate-binding domain-containing protein [Aliiglaciecola sp. LCG003]|uniref:substrate-binding periplasmic protein n=1 Tax=Aliiglaciecola sp. LCG003 TaxID=3053655 RepID=UPI0025725BB5|nr:transporter substrate-binding domain-containing protein [Aliiglaciecola sp. LCG003]WJG09795.1 hypothetical protein QR722_01790 [Aliiglaciecola sp. LCG003]
MQRTLYLFLCLALAITAGSSTAQQPIQTSLKVTVLVDEFAPYINQEHSALGSAAKTLRTLSEYAGIELEWHYIPYADATKILVQRSEYISFPYFYTEQRSNQFLYSKPVAQINNRVFYNRRYLSSLNSDEVSELRAGIVEGNSYGETIDGLMDQPQLFNSEVSALTALMLNEIDVLPMAEGVMNVTLARYFPDQSELIKSVDSINGNEKLHIIAPRSEFGEHIIALFDRAIEAKFQGQAPIDRSTAKPPPVDVAELIPAEGFPAILGLDTKTNSTYTLPIGTRVIVIDWSEAIRQPTVDTRVNRNMMFTSKVVVLNGPHVGKELMIRNMHIKLR